GIRDFHVTGVQTCALPIWLKATQAGQSWPLQDFAPSSVMAAQGRFYPPNRAHNTPIGGANYALHVDAKEMAAYLRRYAQARGVERLEGLVKEVISNEQGNIQALQLDDGRRLEADFFIDCTGFKSLLLGQHLGVELEDWSNYLPC